MFLNEIPISLSQYMKEHDDKPFYPKFSHTSHDPHDLIWSNLSTEFRPVVPGYWVGKTAQMIEPISRKEHKAIAKGTVLEKKEDDDWDEDDMQYMEDQFDAVPKEIFEGKGEENFAQDSEVLDPEEDMKSYLGIFEKAEETISPEKAKEETTDDPFTHLKQEEQTQLEIYKHIDREPYYRHYLVNELSLFSEKFSEMYSAMNQNQLPHFIMKHEHKLKVDESEEKQEKDMQNPMSSSLGSPRHKIFNRKLYHGKAFGSGKRKTCSALAMISEGTGKVEVNYQPLTEYFQSKYYRAMVLKVPAVVNYLCTIDIKLFVHGSGVSSQAQACALAVAKAMCRYDPSQVPLMRKCFLLATDSRQVERKKIGLYKARKKFPYTRR